LWRRSCIEDAGGWQGDTLTEDLDLSYRAQLRGWKLEYRPDIVVPAEIPVQISAFKKQQARWATGSIQTARKILPALWRAPLSRRIKLQGTLHLTGYLVHPLIMLSITHISTKGRVMS
jgi:cellulose synthase/poly-beta-1,6-N-acetylglucosamine synthase-like glycosyltransferase